VWAYIGSTAKSIADVVAGKVEFGVEQKIFLGIGVAMMVVVVIVIAHVAWKALHQAVANPPGPPTD
jgi:hypothetical protein